MRFQDETDHEEEIAFAAEIARALRSQIGRSAIVRQLLPHFVRLLGLDSAGLVAQDQGAWKIEAWTRSGGGSAHQPSPSTLPTELISDAIDHNTGRSDGCWWAVPCQVDLNENGAIISSPLVGCLVFKSDNGSVSPSHESS